MANVEVAFFSIFHRTKYVFGYRVTLFLVLPTARLIIDGYRDTSRRGAVIFCHCVTLATPVLVCTVPTFILCSLASLFC